MANSQLTVTELFADIADAIREKIDSDEKIAAEAFPEAIRRIKGENAESNALWEKIFTRDFTNVSHETATTVGSFAFWQCYDLVSANFPCCTIIGDGAFGHCSRLASISFSPSCTTIGNEAFNQCSCLISVSFPKCTNVGIYAFYYTHLSTAVFPKCVSVDNMAFQACYYLSSVSFPECTTIGDGAFGLCARLPSATFPKCSRVGQAAFTSCREASLFSFPKCTYIGEGAFSSCFKLSNLYLGASSVCTLANSDAFKETPYTGYTSYYTGTPRIYVPSSLLASYKTATNWTYFSSYFTAI